MPQKDFSGVTYRLVYQAGLMMKILESPWFFGLVERRAHRPAERLQAVFSVAGDWLAAPGIREQLAAPANATGLFILKNYLRQQAQAAGAHRDDTLATQLLLLLTGAIAEQLRHPASPAFEDAAIAARTLIRNACKRPARRNQLAGVAATVMLVGLAAWFYPQQAGQPVSPALATSVVYHAATTRLSPDELEAVLALHERIAKGECRAPHMAMLPPGQSTAYMNVVAFRAHQDFAEAQNIRAFMAWFRSVQATECFPKHENDHINTVWVKKVPV